MQMILDRIDSPSDLKKLSQAELQTLADELRQVIIDTVARNGGHLAPGLGVVELTIALHTVFDSPRDKIIWDVGHQAYAHKLLTGRRDRFHTLRKRGGISGFPRRDESEHDHFGTAHASTSISAALGMAKARDLRGDDHAVVAVIGDGAMTGGMAFEGLDHAGHDGTDLIVVLNDNSMSIAPNVGGLSNYMTRLRTGVLYNKFKAELEDMLGRIPAIGKPVAQALERLKDSVKHLVVPGQLFEDLGFNYYGPIDGHNVPLLQATLRSARQKGGPVLLHVLTQKGRGYAFAEAAPDKWHGPGPFDVLTGSIVKSSGMTWSAVFADVLGRLARDDERVVAVTAAMPDGTGLASLMRDYPDRVFDVGIAEQHAATFCAGLATQGMRPFFAVYSTFLQRAVDQVIHDVCLQNLPVTFCIDRAGIVGDDGETHQGVFDIAYLRTVPNLVIAAPKDENELSDLLHTALDHNGPMAIRYPRGKGPGVKVNPRGQVLPIGKAEVLRHGDAAAVLAYGATVEAALQAARELEADGLPVTVVNARFVKPLDAEMLAEVAAKGCPIVTVEEHAIHGGFGSAVVEHLVASGHGDAAGRVRMLGLPDEFIRQGTPAEMKAHHGIDAAGIVQAVQQLCRPGLKLAPAVGTARRA